MLMLVRISFVTLLMLGLSACDSSGSGAANNNGGASSPAPAGDARPARETVTCAEHYGEVRDALLGALRGTETLSLISVTTAHSDGVLSPPAAGSSLAETDCRSSSRSLRDKRKPGSAPAWPLAPQCSALIERVDASCLKPLAERGAPLSKACALALNGVADMEVDGLKRKMANGGFCESVGRDL